MLIRIADSELDPTQRTLRRGGREIDVDPKAFDLLVLLAGRSGELVARDAILAALWPDTIVSDAAVSQCIRRARVAIGDRDAGARLIETVYGHGLRLNARDGAANATAAPRPVALFVGRRAELARLADAFEAVRAKQSRIVWIAGEAGIGKTRLVDEVLRGCAARGATVAWGRCHEDADAPAYWPWAQAMRAMLDATASGVLEAHDANLLARVIPAVRERIGEAAVSGAADSYALFDQWTRLLAKLARDAPLVVALDDLHWADEGTLLLLRFLARERPAIPLLVIGTSRDAERLVELAGGRDSIRLGALSQGDVATLSGARSDAASAARLHRLTGGNPFFVVELLAQLGDAELASLDRAAPPPSVRGFVRDRIARLAEPVRALLAAGAVLGEELSPRTLRAVVARRGDPTEALRAAVAAGLVEPSGAHALRFVHALVREVLYDALGDREKATLHARAARAIETGDRSESASQAEALAHHYCAAVEANLRAGRRSDARQVASALRNAEHAAQRAAAVGSWQESARHAARALALPQGPRPRLALTVVLGEAQMHAGAVDAGRATLHDAAQLARERRAWPELARIAFARAGRFGRTLSAEDPEALALLDEVLGATRSGAPDPNDARYAQVAARRALVYKPALPDPTRRELLAHAERLARRAGDDAVLSYVLWARHLSSWDPRELAQRRALSQELLAVARRGGDVEIEATARICGIRDAIDAGDLGALGAAIAAYETMIDRVRHPVVRFYLTPRRVMQALVEGRCDDAERLILEGLAAPDVHEVRAQIVDPLPGQFIFLRREQGRMREMEAAIDAFASGNDRIPFVIAIRGLALVALGRLDDARAQLEDLATSDFEDIAFDHNRLMVFALAADLCEAVGDRRRAERLYELLAPFDGHHVVVADGLAFLDTVARPLGILAAARGDRRAAIAHLEDAVRIHRAIGARTRLAQTERDLERVRAMPAELRAVTGSVRTRPRER